MASIPTAQPNRSLFNHSAAGKGDQDRSPGWRENYPEIRWPGVTGLQRVGTGKYRKVYGTKPECEV